MAQKSSSASEMQEKRNQLAADEDVKSLYFNLINNRLASRRNAINIDNAERFQEDLQQEYQKELQRDRETKFKKDEKEMKKFLKKQKKLRKTKLRGGSESSERDEDGEVPFFMRDASIRAAFESSQSKDRKKSSQKSRKQHEYSDSSSDEEQTERKRHRSSKSSSTKSHSKSKRERSSGRRRSGEPSSKKRRYDRYEDERCAAKKIKRKE